MTKIDRYRFVAGVIALVAFGARLAYVLSQPEGDPPVEITSAGNPET